MSRHNPSVCWLLETGRHFLLLKLLCGNTAESICLSSVFLLVDGMDAFMYAVDPYRQASADYYAPRYPLPYSLERRTSFGLVPVDAITPYVRVPVDPVASYGAGYGTDIVIPAPRFVSGRIPFRPRSRSGVQQNLGPRKKPFKQTQKVRLTDEKKVPSKKQTVKEGNKTLFKSSLASQSASLMQETKDLHVLFRTGVDKIKVVKYESKKSDADGSAKKRKADTASGKPSPIKNSKSGKNQKGKKKKLAKQKKDTVPEVEIAPPTEEQIEEAEAALDMQRGFCKGVSECLGLPEVKEAVVSEGVEPENNMEPMKDAEETVKDSDETDKKFVELQRTPEEEKEVEAKSLEYFSGLFADHPELRNLYVDKCNSGSFECLVCNSVDTTRSKKFWNVVSLVIHTKMRKQLRSEHSGYGHAISAVLGWDHEKLPKVPRGARPVAFTGKAALEKDVLKHETTETTVVNEQLEVELIAEESKEEDGTDLNDK